VAAGPGAAGCPSFGGGAAGMMAMKMAKSDIVEHPIMPHCIKASYKDSKLCMRICLVNSTSRLCKKKDDNNACCFCCKCIHPNKLGVAKLYVLESSTLHHEFNIQFIPLFAFKQVQEEKQDGKMVARATPQKKRWELELFLSPLHSKNEQSYTLLVWSAVTWVRVAGARRSTTYIPYSH
jgi:hypothetical protein